MVAANVFPGCLPISRCICLHPTIRNSSNQIWRDSSFEIPGNKILYQFRELRCSRRCYSMSALSPPIPTYHPPCQWLSIEVSPFRRHPQPSRLPPNLTAARYTTTSRFIPPFEISPSFKIRYDLLSTRGVWNITSHPFFTFPPLTRLRGTWYHFPFSSQISSSIPIPPIPIPIVHIQTKPLIFKA